MLLGAIALLGLLPDWPLMIIAVTPGALVPPVQAWFFLVPTLALMLLTGMAARTLAN
jgi:hypothetical protein